MSQRNSGAGWSSLVDPTRKDKVLTFGCFSIFFARYLVELTIIDELEELWRGVELVGRPDQKRQCDDFGSVLLIVER
eukprot:8269810-Pyramimonas_sp.AAC.1